MHMLVIIPVRNRPHMVVEALDSVAGQTLPPSAITVVDDGSTDDTAARVAQWIADRPNVGARLIRVDHMGAPSARNHGLNAWADHPDAVLFLDSDDLLPADFLERTISVFERDPFAVAVSTDQESVDVGRMLKKHVDTSGVASSPWLFMLQHGAALASCTLFRAGAIREAGGFPQHVPTGHDAILFGRVARLGAWHHVSGEPVRFRRNYAGSGAPDADHLHKSYPDYEARWAAAIEQLAREAPMSIGRAGWKLVNRSWRRAALQALERKDRNQAFLCITSAFRCYPWSRRNLGLLFRFFLFRYVER